MSGRGELEWAGQRVVVLGDDTIARAVVEVLVAAGAEVHCLTPGPSAAMPPGHASSNAVDPGDEPLQGALDRIGAVVNVVVDCRGVDDDGQVSAMAAPLMRLGGAVVGILPLGGTTSAVERAARDLRADGIRVNAVQILPVEGIEPTAEQIARAIVTMAGSRLDTVTGAVVPLSPPARVPSPPPGL